MEISESIVDLGRSGAGAMKQAPRPSGLHLSEIIGFIEGRKRDSGGPDAEAFTRFEMGFIWEDLIQGLFASRMMERMNLVPQSGIIIDGVHMTPDAFDTRNWRLHEFKATWKKLRPLDEFEDTHWGWLVQVKGYCWGLQTRAASITAFYVNGDYRGSGPTIRRIDLEFTNDELKDNWNMIMKNGAVIRKNKRAK